MGQRLQPVVAAPLPITPAPPPSTRGNPASFEEALLGHTWSWENARDHDRSTVVQFQPNGIVSGGWHWKIMPKTNGLSVVDCFWGDDQHMYLTFNKQFSEFAVYGGGPEPDVKGQRLKPLGQNVSLANAPTTPRQQ